MNPEKKFFTGFGNDVLWRTLADLNKLILYADSEGVLQGARQRRYLAVVDGIVGLGEVRLLRDMTLNETVAGDSSVPVLLYTVPKFTHLAIPPEVVERLATHPNIVGMKDSSGDLRSLHAFLERTPPDFQVITGSPLIAGAAGAAGAVGAILGMANLAPELCIECFAAGCSGDLVAMRALQTELNALTHAVQGAFGIPGLKAAADLLGGCGGAPRRPIPVLTDGERERISAALRDAGLEPVSPAEPD